MNSIIIDNKEKWEQALTSYPNSSFLQSWAWGEFQKELGFTPLRFACSDNNSLVAIAQIYPVKTKFFHFLYCPRGPYAKSPQAYLQILNDLSFTFRKTNYHFLLVEPNEIKDNITIQELSTENVIAKPTRQLAGRLKQSRPGSPRPASGGTRDDAVFSFPKSYQVHPFFIQPSHTAFVSLDKSIDELYRNFRKTTRAEIKKAKENKIQIVSYQDSKYLNVFADLYREFLVHKKYKAHSTQYIKKQFELFTKEKQVKLYLAYQNKAPLASAIILFYNQTATYLHAAASVESKKLGASQTLLWQVIKDAKAAKQTVFDLWGVAPLEEKDHPLTQISVFKRGFSDCEIVYPLPRACINNYLFYKFYFATRFLKNAKVYRSFQRSMSKTLTRV